MIILSLIIYIFFILYFIYNNVYKDKLGYNKKMIFKINNINDLCFKLRCEYNHIEYLKNYEYGIKLKRILNDEINKWILYDK